MSTGFAGGDFGLRFIIYDIINVINYKMLRLILLAQKINITLTVILIKTVNYSF